MSTSAVGGTLQYDSVHNSLREIVGMQGKIFIHFCPLTHTDTKSEQNIRAYNFFLSAEIDFDSLMGNQSTLTCQIIST